MGLAHVVKLISMVEMSIESLRNLADSHALDAVVEVVVSLGTVN